MPTQDTTQGSKTTFRVMKTHEFENSVFYRIACDCADPEHDMSMEMSVDKFPVMELNLYWNTETTLFWGTSNWFKLQWDKLKIITRLIFTSRITLQGNFLLCDEAHINSLIDALKEGRDKLKANMEDENARLQATKTT